MSSFIICEKLFSLNNMKVKNNVGKNVTLFTVFGQFLALDCEYNSSFLKGYL